ncbi:MAG: tetratricopeptide repeat protein [Nitrospira sp.]|nr:tetratricopeptide repeat protein [Nitrospira sp.]
MSAQKMKACALRMTKSRWGPTFVKRLSLGIVPCIFMACAGAPNLPGPVPAQATFVKQSIPSPPDSAAMYHFMLGYQAELARDNDRALREYQTALKADPSSREVKARMAGIYLGLGNLSQAVQMAEEVGEGSGQEVQLLVQMAGILVGAGKPDHALRLLDKAIEQTPNRGEAYFPKGIILLNQKRAAEAEQTVKQGLTYAPDSPIGLYYLGRISLEVGNDEQAVTSFDRAMAVSPSFEPAYLAQASLHESRQEKEKAIAILQKYLHQVNPRNKDIRQHLIKLYMTTKDYAGALAELEGILEDDPTDLDAQLRVALIYGEKKEFTKAIDRLTAILKVRPSELKVRDYLGYLYEETKDVSKAVETYQFNLQQDPDFIDSHIHLGVLQYRQKKFPDAIRHLSDAVRLTPRQPEPRIVLGLAYLQSDQFEKASLVFEEGVRHNPKSADMHFNLGTVYDKLNRFDDVVRAMEAAISLDPHHADALNYLGYSYAERGIKIDLALSLTRRAVALKPENGYYVDSLGWAFYKSGLLAEALTEIKRAVLLVGDDPVIYEHLGEIYIKQLNLSDAREAWLHSLELDPSNEKLFQRFREQGMGDPSKEDRIQQAKRRVADQKSPAQALP